MMLTNTCRLGLGGRYRFFYSRLSDLAVVRELSSRGRVAVVNYFSLDHGPRVMMFRVRLRKLYRLCRRYRRLLRK